MNEAVLRSPKWLRNIADFEINTGDDIKGSPSKRKQKKLDEEEERRKEEERLRKEREEDEREEEEQRNRIREKEKEDEEFKDYFKLVMAYIRKNYKLCKISVPKNDFIIIEKYDIKYAGSSDFEFKITLDNTVPFPKIVVYIKVDKNKYDNTVTGSSYAEFKMFLINEVFFYHRHNSGNYDSSQSKSNQSKSDKKNNTNYNSGPFGDYEEDEYDDYYNDFNPKYDTKQKEKPKESEEIKNKRRRYELLKDVLAGHQRKLSDCLSWERKNTGKTHPDKITTQNEINATKSKINMMNTTYHFESIYYLKHLKPILS